MLSPVLITDGVLQEHSQVSLVRSFHETYYRPSVLHGLFTNGNSDNTVSSVCFVYRPLFFVCHPEGVNLT